MTQSSEPKNLVVFDNWYAQPIHCPFCGEALPADEQVSCKHLLYIISAGNFCTRSELFDQELGLEPESGPCWPELSRDEIHLLGKPYEVANRVRGRMDVSIEYEIRNPSDSAFIGFAALDDELCGWGRNHQSPY
jgi:hypothetical protein